MSSSKRCDRQRIFFLFKLDLQDSSWPRPITKNKWPLQPSPNDIYTITVYNLARISQNPIEIHTTPIHTCSQIAQQHRIDNILNKVHNFWKYQNWRYVAVFVGWKSFFLLRKIIWTKIQRKSGTEYLDYQVVKKGNQVEATVQLSTKVFNSDAMFSFFWLIV